MPDSRLLSRSPSTFLLQEHEWIRQLFQLHARTDAGDTLAKDALFRKIRHEVRAHGAIEAEYFYPTLKDFVPSIPEDHSAMEGLLDKLSGMKSSDRSYDALMKLLEENFTLHAAVEERDFLPKLRRLSLEAQHDLAVQMTAMRDEIEREGAY